MFVWLRKSCFMQANVAKLKDKVTQVEMFVLLHTS